MKLSDILDDDALVDIVAEQMLETYKYAESKKDRKAARRMYKYFTPTNRWFLLDCTGDD